MRNTIRFALAAAVLAVVAAVLGGAISRSPRATEHLAAPFLFVSTLAAAGVALTAAAALE